MMQTELIKDKAASTVYIWGIYDNQAEILSIEIGISSQAKKEKICSPDLWHW